VNTTNKTPILDYNQEFGRWSLRLNRTLSEEDASEEDTSYEMLVNVSWADPHTFTFIMWMDGEWFEACTNAEYDQRVQAIRDHEGQAIADLWDSEQEQVTVLRDDHPVFALRAHWEAMMTLNLFLPTVTYREWHGKPTSENLNKRLNALRQAEMEAERRAMAEEEAASKKQGEE
jgi:hypothetical protein